jgi:Flp pilus assembly protein protease CpaA
MWINISMFKNQKGSSAYKLIVMATMAIAIVVLIVLLKRSAKLQQQAPDLERQAQDSGVNLEDFK